jgi:PilZ domain
MAVRLACHVGSTRNWPGTLEGVTDNISRNGLSIELLAEQGSEMPEIGEMVTVEIDLPANHSFSKKCIHCQATVLRITRENRTAKLALSISHMKFQDLGARIPAVEAKAG